MYNNSYNFRLIQLAFHDCLRYEDGTGGCDGCLNWAGMGWNSHSMEIKVKLSQMLAFQMKF